LKSGVINILGGNKFMRKTISLVCLICLVLFSTTFYALSNNDNLIQNASALRIEDFVIFEENLLIKLKSDTLISNNISSYEEQFVIHASDHRFQIIDRFEDISILHFDYYTLNYDTIKRYPRYFTNVYEIAEGEFRSIFQYDGFKEEDITDIEPTEISIILQEPLIVGHSWMNVILEVESMSEIVSINEIIQTPFGVFEDVLKVTTSFPNGDSGISYFALGYGFIKSVFQSGENLFNPIITVVTSIVNSK